MLEEKATGKEEGSNGKTAVSKLTVHGGYLHRRHRGKLTRGDLSSRIGKGTVEVKVLGEVNVYWTILRGEWE